MRPRRLRPMSRPEIVEQLSDAWTDEDLLVVERALADARADGDHITANRREKLLRLMADDFVATELRRSVAKLFS